MLPQFLSPYLPKLLEIVLHPSLHEKSQAGEAHESTQAVLNAIAKGINPRVLLQPLFAQFSSAVKNGKNVSCLCLTGYDAL